MEKFFIHREFKEDILDNIILEYRKGNKYYIENGEEKDRLKIIIECFLKKIEYIVKRQIGTYDEDIISDIISNIHKWVISKTISHNKFSRYILSKIKGYVKDYKLKKISYMGLPINKKRIYAKLLKKELNNTLTDEELSLKEELELMLVEISSENLRLKEDDVEYSEFDEYEFKKSTHQDNYYTIDNISIIQEIKEFLTQEEFEMLELCFVDGKSYREVGEMYGCSKKTMHNRISRILKKVRVKFKNYDEIYRT